MSELEWPNIVGWPLSGPAGSYNGKSSFLEAPSPAYGGTAAWSKKAALLWINFREGA